MKRVVFAIFLFVASIVPFCGNAQQQDKSAVEQLQKLNRFYRMLNGMYVDSIDMRVNEFYCLCSKKSPNKATTAYWLYTLVHLC